MHLNVKSKLMNVRIEEPCHEDWNKMIPESTGAFCNSCAKSVIDFTNKTKNEIKTFFESNKGKEVCGRFTEDQLTEMSVDEFVTKLQYYNPIKKFAITLFLTFGMWLFGSSNLNAQTGNKPKLMGKPSYHPQEEVVKGKIKTPTDTTKQKEPKKPKTILGGPKYIPEPQPTKVGMVIYRDPEIITPSKDETGKPN